jgi:hypothetical protein
MMLFPSEEVHQRHWSCTDEQEPEVDGGSGAEALTVDVSLNKHVLSLISSQAAINSYRFARKPSTVLSSEENAPFPYTPREVTDKDEKDRDQSADTVPLPLPSEQPSASGSASGGVGNTVVEVARQSLLRCTRRSLLLRLPVQAPPLPALLPPVPSDLAQPNL